MLTLPVVYQYAQRHTKNVNQRVGMFFTKIDTPQREGSATNGVTLSLIQGRRNYRQKK